MSLDPSFDWSCEKFPDCTKGSHSDEEDSDNVPAGQSVDRGIGD